MRPRPHLDPCGDPSRCPSRGPCRSHLLRNPRPAPRFYNFVISRMIYKWAHDGRDLPGLAPFGPAQPACEPGCGAPSGVPPVEGRPGLFPVSGSNKAATNVLVWTQAFASPERRGWVSRQRRQTCTGRREAAVWSPFSVVTISSCARWWVLEGFTLHLPEANDAGRLLCSFAPRSPMRLLFPPPISQLDRLYSTGLQGFPAHPAYQPSLHTRFAETPSRVQMAFPAS